MAIDLKKVRNLGGAEFGTNVVAANATWQAGQIAAYSTDSAGNTTVTVAGTGNTAAGVFKYEKATTMYGVAVKEALVLTGTTAGSLDHANISNVLVEDSAGTDYAVTTDYTVNTVNGTITRSGTASAIITGDTVYVTYTYQKTEAEVLRDGKNLYNTNDYTAGSNRITVYQGNWRLYTDQFDTSLNYTVGAQLYVGATGKFTAAVLTNKAGRVVDVPTAANPFLGVEGSFIA